MPGCKLKKRRKSMLIFLDCISTQSFLLQRQLKYTIMGFVMNNNSYFSSKLLTVTLLAGCETAAVKPNHALDLAHKDFDIAQSNPNISGLAALKMKLASDTLEKADEAASKRQGTATIDHLAYIANQPALPTLILKPAMPVTLSPFLPRERRRGLSNRCTSFTLKHYPHHQVFIEGYTDCRGSNSYNQAVSVRRAMKVQQSLIGMGISADRISLCGYGEEHQVASNLKAATRQLNRRLEVILSEANGNFLQH